MVCTRESIIDIANRTSNNEFDILVAFKLDRIGRKGNETTNFITGLLEKGIRVFTVVEGEITADSFEDEFMLTFRGLSAKQESRNISVRVKVFSPAMIDFLHYNCSTYKKGGDKMYLLSRLIEEYLCSAENFNKRRNAFYLSNWIGNMIDSGYQCQSMYNFQKNFDVTQASYTFECIMKELGLLKKYNVAEINEEFLFRVTLHEYKKGYYNSACEFLYHKNYIADKLHFPFTIKYSVDTDDYYTNHMKGIELENFVSLFLMDNGIFRK